MAWYYGWPNARQGIRPYDDSKKVRYDLTLGIYLGLGAFG